jgi:hypothetical protein
VPRLLQVYLPLLFLLWHLAEKKASAICLSLLLLYVDVLELLAAVVSAWRRAGAAV